MILSVQRWFAALGESGCYVICLVRTAEQMLGKQLDIFTEFVKLVNSKLVYLNTTNFNDPRNCEVQDTSASLKAILDGGVSFRYRKEPGVYVPKANEFVVEKWVNGNYIHFVTPDFDPLGNSQTRLRGKCVEKRVFEVVA